ncbi:thioredoxin family protein [Haliangium sp.]|uniref:thioredoxin family protein n=1 Tax=Haliangium sp. TaxID=2663208 RepID=UPI003D0A1256
MPGFYDYASLSSSSSSSPGRALAVARAAVVAAALAVLGVGCSKSEPAAEPAAAPAAESAAKPAAAVAAAAATAGDADPCAGAEAHGPLRWFHDDYQAALACARAQDKPLFIDNWAPWCHTCLSMKHTVFADAGLAPLAERFVWLAVDTDKEENAAAVAKFPPQVWPTFYVVAPADESVQGRYLGAASLDELRAFLSEGERGFLESKGQALAEDSPLGRERRGDRAATSGDFAAAATAYAEALTVLPADAPRRADVLVKRISALYKADDSQACVEMAEAELAHSGRSASASDFVYYAHICAGEIADAGRGKALRESLAAYLAPILDDAEAPMSVDDRSDGLRILREIKDELGQEEAAKALAVRQRALLDQAWAEAPDAFARMTFVWPMVEVYVYQGEGEALLSEIEKLEAELPTQYDPPYRLAWVLHRLGREDEAAAAAERALPKMYGPRKARAQALLADIHGSRGDKAAELAAREAVVATYAGLPEGQKQPAALAAAQEALAQAKAKPAE